MTDNVPYYAGLWTVSGPSGAGKSTLLVGLWREFPYSTPLKRFTTRPLRAGDCLDEIESVSLAQLDRHIEDGSALARFPLHGNWYGPSRELVHQALNGSLVIGDISFDPLWVIRAYALGFGKPWLVRSVFLVIDDEDELRRRLVKRGEQDVERRLADCRKWNERAHTCGLPFHFIDARQSPEQVLADAVEFFTSTNAPA